MPVHNPEALEVKDEGTTQGRARTLDFTGAGVSASVSGQTATINITGGASAELLFNKHIITSDITITAGYTVYIPRYMEPATGVTVEIGADADLEIG